MGLHVKPTTYSHLNGTLERQSLSMERTCSHGLCTKHFVKTRTLKKCFQKLKRAVMKQTHASTLTLHILKACIQSIH